MTNQLIKLNSLEINTENIWVNASDSIEFGYSDGIDEEQYLISALNGADDVGLDSVELVKASRDWVTEYHLSSVRANLLRNITLPDQAKILEVGCGCGAITRYLGEQNFRVDAIEGSAARAKISKLRCRDLDNVTIIRHDFNTLKLPLDNYDAVLFIGVLEYAKRFIDDEQLSSEQAVVRLLNKSAATLSRNGIIIVAIENRIGLKYLNGAFEDHLARPNVGIDNYDGYEFTGIKTYDNSQWIEILKQAGLAHRLFFPFGDYKFPNMVINGDVDESTVAYLSSQIHSRDQISPWQMPALAEYQHWSDSIRSEKLSESSNSFGLVIAKHDKTLDNLFTDHWTLFDNIELKPEFRVDLNSTTDTITIDNNSIGRYYNNSHHYANSLAVLWQNQLIKDPGLNTLVLLSSQLYTLFKHYWPQNIRVDFDQLFVSKHQDKLDYAKYWVTNRKVTREQQLLHFLTGFCLTNTKLLSTFKPLVYLSLEEVINHCIEKTLGTGKLDLTKLLNNQDDFRMQVLHSPSAIRDDLACVLSNHNQYKFRHITSQLYVGGQCGQFSAEHCISKRIKQTPRIQTLRYEQLNCAKKYIRFDPCNHEYGNQHYFCLHSVKLFALTDNSILEIKKSDLTDFLTSHYEVELINVNKAIFKVNGIDPQLLFSLPQELTKITDRYNLDIQLQWLGV